MYVSESASASEAAHAVQDSATQKVQDGQVKKRTLFSRTAVQFSATQKVQGGQGNSRTYRGERQVLTAAKLLGHTEVAQLHHLGAR